MQQHTIGDEHAGERLDAVLPALAGWSRTSARRLCAFGAAAVNGVRSPGTLRLRKGDVVSWNATTHDLALQLGLPVLFADDDAIVVHKPPGLAAHQGPLVEDSLADRLLALPGSGLAHRLDRGASGTLLIGRSPKALAALGAQMETGAIARDYLAIAHGLVDGEQRTIDLPLFATDEPRGNMPKVIVDRERGQRAVTHLTVVARSKDSSLVRLRLETGRTHQIRAHLLAIGHPLLGDPRYGDPLANERARSTHGIDRPLLHGEQLQFAQPTSGAAIVVRSFHEPDFARLFRQLP